MGARHRVADEADIAAKAFLRFCAAAEQGKMIPHIRDRNALWPLLIRITAQRDIDARRKEVAFDAQDVRGESVFGTAESEISPGMAGMIGDEPSPELAAVAVEQIRRLLGALRDDEHRQIAILWSEGHTLKEIATQLGCSVAKVERAMKIVRKVFEREYE